jgi:hypothetical protein
MPFLFWVGFISICVLALVGWADIFVRSLNWKSARPALMACLHIGRFAWVVLGLLVLWLEYIVFLVAIGK